MSPLQEHPRLILVTYVLDLFKFCNYLVRVYYNLIITLIKFVLAYRGNFAVNC